MAEGIQVRIYAGPMSLQNMMLKVTEATMAAAVEMQPLLGGTQANPKIIPNGPAGFTRKRELSPGWYKLNGNDVEVVKGKRWLWWWENTFGAILDLGDLPKGTDGTNGTNGTNGKDANLGDWDSSKTYVWVNTGDQYVLYQGKLWSIAANQTAGAADIPGVSNKWILKTTDTSNLASKSELKDSTKILPSTAVNWASGIYINLSGGQSSLQGYQSTNQISIADSVKKIVLEGNISYGSVQNNIAFYDLAGAFISGLQIPTTTSPVVVDVPVGSVGYRLSNIQTAGVITSYFMVSDVVSGQLAKEPVTEASINKWTDGYYLNTLGVATANSAWSISDFIFVPDDALQYSARVLAQINLSAVAWYASPDATTFISSTVINTQTTYWKENFVKPSGANYARVTLTSVLKTSAKVYFKSLFKLMSNLDLNLILDYFLFSPSKFTVGKYISSSNGKLMTASNWTYSDFIPCSSADYALFSGGSGASSAGAHRISFYRDKSEAGYISGIPLPASGATTWNNEPIMFPAGANYLRLCASTLANMNSYRLRLKLNSIIKVLQREINVLNTENNESKIVVPEYLDSVIGRNNDIFFDFSNLNPESNGGTMVVTGNDSAANFLRRGNGIRHVPVPASTNNALTYSLFDRKMNRLEEKRLIVRPVSRSVGDGISEKMICASGDSIAENQNYPTELYRLLDEDGDHKFIQIGTRGSVGGKHEARGSWGWKQYVNPEYENSPYQGKTNAFMFSGLLNFQQYMQTNYPDLTRKEIDIFSMPLGTNDVGQGIVVATDAEIDEIIAYAKIFIDAFFSADRGFPNAKFIVGLCAIGAPELHIGDRSATIFKRSISKLNQKYIEVFDNGKYHPRVTTVMHGAYIDRINSYQFVDEPVNDYVTQTVRRYTDGIHPQQSGYRQLARGMYGKIRAILAGNL